MELLLFDLLLSLLPILLGVLILLVGIGKPARLRAIIGYEIPIMLLVPLAFCVALPNEDFFNDSGLSPVFSIFLMALPAICASASALLRGRGGLLSGLIGGAMLLLAEAAFFAFSGRDGALILLACPVYLLFLCMLGYGMDKRLSANTDCPASAVAEAASQMTTEPVHAAPTDRKERNSNTMYQKLKPGSAIRRGVIGAAIGAIAMAILFIAIGGDFGNVLYGMFCGTLYGFGFAFANWGKLLRNTRKAAAEGTAGLGIGVILSRLTDDNNWGIFGWLYFIFRIAFALGFGWIPGIWYGIRAIRAELKEEYTSAPAKSAPKRPAPAASRPAAAPAAADPVLYCLSGAFAGAEFPLKSGEVITLGSDPARCQVILTGEDIQGEHCRLWLDRESSDWYAVALSGSRVSRDGIRPLAPDAVTLLPRGTVLSIGQGANSQRFRLG